MIVSFLNWQYTFWTDLSKQWSEVFHINKLEYQRILDWSAYIQDWVVLDIDHTKKRDEKKRKSISIINEYSITDQLNIMRKVLCSLSEDRELHIMDEFIGNILVSNWEDEWGLE